MKNIPIPTRQALTKLGQDIKDARKRRHITIALLAERAGLSRTTITKIEKGEATTSIGAVASVIFVLGMINRLSDLVDARHDLTGRQLADEALPQRIRYPKRNNHDT